MNDQYREFATSIILHIETYQVIGYKKIQGKIFSHGCPLGPKSLVDLEVAPQTKSEEVGTLEVSGCDQC